MSLHESPRIESNVRGRASLLVTMLAGESSHGKKRQPLGAQDHTPRHHMPLQPCLVPLGLHWASPVTYQNCTCIAAPLREPQPWCQIRAWAPAAGEGPKPGEGRSSLRKLLCVGMRAVERKVEIFRRKSVVTVLSEV